MVRKRKSSAWDQDGAKFFPNAFVKMPPEIPFVNSTEKPPEFTAGDFWSWAYSDLVDNATRGVLAEFLVAQALGLELGPKAHWEPFDLETPAGTRIEVKASGYLQAWAQRKHSVIQFSGLKAKAWDKKTGLHAEEATFNADMYVFCKQTSVDHDQYDVLNVEQWAFFVVPLSYVKEKGLNSLTEKTILRDGVTSVGFNELANEFSRIENQEVLSMPKQKTARKVPGWEPFESSIASASETGQQLLRTLLAWARKLEDDSLCKLVTTIGKSRNGLHALRVELVGDNRCLITIYNEPNNAHVVAQGSVIRGQAPVAAVNVELSMEPQELKNGSTVNNVSEEFLSAIGEAYREASHS